MRQFWQPIAAFLYCNFQAAGGCRRQAKDGNFHAPAGACATERTLNSAHGSSSVIFQTWFHVKIKH